jgi:plasmid maintenance system antidote protein VapI
VAQDIGLLGYQLEDLIQEKGRIDVDLTCRLACYFQIGTEVFLNIQQIYDWEYGETYYKNKKKSKRNKFYIKILYEK